MLVPTQPAHIGHRNVSWRHAENPKIQHHLLIPMLRVSKIGMSTPSPVVRSFSDYWSLPTHRLGWRRLQGNWRWIKIGTSTPCVSGCEPCSVTDRLSPVAAVRMACPGEWTCSDAESWVTVMDMVLRDHWRVARICFSPPERCIKSLMVMRFWSPWRGWIGAEEPKARSQRCLSGRTTWWWVGIWKRVASAFCCPITPASATIF